MSGANSVKTEYPKTQEAWRKALDDLPSTPQKIPAFFFGHGSPMLAFPDGLQPNDRMLAILKSHGPNGILATFLKDFGPALLEKYKPKAIVVFSAHWETLDERVGMYHESGCTSLQKLMKRCVHSDGLRRLKSVADGLLWFPT